VRPFLIALQFLTRVPVHLAQAPTQSELGRSLAWYPLIGLLIGLVLLASGSLLAHQMPVLKAAIVLGLWIACTGALHLDGLADLADGWVGGHGDRERTLAIMKDPHAGSMAVVAVVCVLILKFAALTRVLADPLPWPDLRRAAGCVLPALLARTAVPLLLATTPYVRPRGIGSALVAAQSRTSAWLIAGVVMLVTLLWAGRIALLALAASAVTLWILRRACVRRLGGITGDCAGAAIELIEVASVLALALS
jgi:adenosylcobinamide-GDP ribazoletransferase